MKKISFRELRGYSNLYIEGMKNRLKKFIITCDGLNNQ